MADEWQKGRTRKGQVQRRGGRGRFICFELVRLDSRVSGPQGRYHLWDVQPESLRVLLTMSFSDARNEGHSCCGVVWREGAVVEMRLRRDLAILSTLRKLEGELVGTANQTCAMM